MTENDPCPVENCEGVLFHPLEVGCRCMSCADITKLKCTDCDFQLDKGPIILNRTKPLRKIILR